MRGVRRSTAEMLAVLALVLATTSPAQAFIGPRPADPLEGGHPIFYQVIGGVLVHNVFMPFLFEENERRDSDSVDVLAEIQFNPLPFDTGNRALNIFTTARPHLGIAVNTSGEESRGYFGLTFSLIDTDRFFFELSFGGALFENFITELETDAFGNDIEIGRPALGGVFQFRSLFDIGFRITERQWIAISYEHNSNAEIFEENDGLDNLGVRYGFRF